MNIINCNSERTFNSTSKWPIHSIQPYQKKMLYETLQIFGRHANKIKKFLGAAKYKVDVSSNDMLEKKEASLNYILISMYRLHITCNFNSLLFFFTVQHFFEGWRTGDRTSTSWLWNENRKLIRMLIIIWHLKNDLIIHIQLFLIFRPMIAFVNHL